MWVRMALRWVPRLRTVGMNLWSVGTGLSRVQSVLARVLRGSLPVIPGCRLLFLWPGRMHPFKRFSEFLWWSLMNYTEMFLWWRVWISHRHLPHCCFVYLSQFSKICETCLLLIKIDVLYGVDIKSCHKTLID